MRWTSNRGSSSVTRVDARRRFGAVISAIVCVALLFCSQAKGQSSDDVTEDLLHSDLPLFGRGGDTEWPQHFSDGDSFGCTSRVAFGDWALRKQGADVEGDVRWFRFSNYGVFHCWANKFRAYERNKLGGANSYPSFFVLLDTVSVAGKGVELWALQIGARPGSDYLLLSRTPVKGVIATFSVLQSACPAANLRDAGSLDILLTRYCVVRSREALTRLARDMAQRPPLGTLTLFSTVDEKMHGDRE